MNKLILTNGEVTNDEHLIIKEVTDVYKKLLQGIKLLPKNLEKIYLKNGRPLTLLQIIYKIIAKLLAVQLGKTLPSLISPRQTGSVPGRQFLDNISLAYLIHNWAKQTE